MTKDDITIFKSIFSEPYSVIALMCLLHVKVQKKKKKIKIGRHHDYKAAALHNYTLNIVCLRYHRSRVDLAAILKA